MAFVVQISDPHLRLDDQRDRAAAALRRAVAAIGEFPRAPDAIVVTGDVADTGHPGEYAQALELLAPLTAPRYVIPGNHDDPAALHDAFGPQPDAVDAGGLRLVLCDTTIAGQPGGRLDTDRLDGLLAADPAPALVAMHHPPLDTGMPFLDRIGLEAGARERLATVLERHPHVARVACGHVHRVIVETLAGCVVISAPGTDQQAEPDPTSDIGLRFVHRGTGVLLHHLRADGTVLSHMQPTTDEFSATAPSRTP